MQGGTQRRSDEGLREAIDYVKQGNLGAIKLVRGLVYVRRDSIGKVDGPQPVPESVDYNLWCGPSPMLPLTRKSLHYDWHWVWPTGDGDFGNNGIHYIDVCRWVVGKNELAPRVLSFGGRFGYVDDGETPNTQVVFLDYKPVPILFEVRGLPRAKGDSAMDNYRGIRDGVVVHCENGYLAGGWAYDNSGKRIKQFRLTEGAGHHENFIKAVRSRKVSDLNADVLEGYLSAALCHMGNISYRLGQTASPSRDSGTDRAATRILRRSFERVQDHLLLNGVDVKLTPRVLGPWLTMDPQTETIHRRVCGRGQQARPRDLSRALCCSGGSLMRKSMISRSAGLSRSSLCASSSARLLRASRRERDRRSHAAEYFRAKRQKLQDRCLERHQAGWRTGRPGEPVYRQQLLEMLGLDPLPQKSPLKATVTGHVEHEQFTVEKLHYQSMPGLYVTGESVRPEGPRQAGPRDPLRLRPRRRQEGRRSATAARSPISITANGLPGTATSA